MTRTRIQLAAVAAIAGLLVAPAAIAADVYEVSAVITQGADTIGEPGLRVDPDAPARVVVSGERGYELFVRLKPGEDTDAVEVEVQLKTSHGSLSSTVTTPMDRPISVATGEIGLSLTVGRDQD